MLPYMSKITILRLKVPVQIDVFDGRAATDTTLSYLVSVALCFRLDFCHCRIQAFALVGGSFE